MLKNRFLFLNKFSLYLIALVLIMGVILRFVKIGDPVYWFDEIYTGFRAAGFTSEEIYQTLFQNQLFTALDLQHFLEIKPGSGWHDTLNSLAQEDPQHPPLYFLLARWILGSGFDSLTAIRCLSAIISLGSIPLIYQWARELFNSRDTALIASMLLAFSPLDIIYAQTARQYSLLTLLTIASSLYLWQALTRESQNWGFWIGYIIIGIAAIYTHPFWLLTAVAQGCFVLICPLRPRVKLYFFLALTIIILAFSPWLSIIITNYDRIAQTTGWSSYQIQLQEYLYLTFLNFTAILIDLNNLFWLRFLFLIIVIVSLLLIIKYSNFRQKLFLLTLTFIPFLILLLADLVLGGKRSTVTRYLIACFPGMQLMVAYLLAFFGQKRPLIGRVLLSIILTTSLISNYARISSPTWWNKSVSYYNPAIATVINASTDPLIISDRGDNYLNQGNLIALSYLLKPEVKLFLVSYPPKLQKLAELTTGNNLFSYSPSQQLLDSLHQQGYNYHLIPETAALWQIEPEN